MQFEWDVNKDQRNRVKHGISFRTASLVFSDPKQLSIQDRYVDGEERWQTLGRIGEVVVLLVAHRYDENDSGEEVIRIISARKATTQERQHYERQF